MFLKWSKLRPPSRFSNRIYRKSLGIGLGVLLMAVFSVAPADVRLVNISTRAPIQGGAGDIIAGFIIEGTGTQRVVIRGWDLEPGVDAKLTLRKFPSSELVASNDNWQDDPRSAEIPSHMISHYDKFDAALLLDLAAGAYTVTLSSMGEKGLGLVGIDAIDGTAIKLINISTRAPIQGGAGDVIAGFIIEGTETQRVVIRGWDLEPEVDAKLTIRKFPSSEFVASNDNWQDDSRYAEIPSHMISHYDKFDAALLLDLAAGAYTVTLSSVGAKGIGLVGVDAIDTPNTGGDPKEPSYDSDPKPGNTLDFGSTSVGTPVSYDLLVSEVGDADLVLNSSRISGTNANDFRVSTTFPLTLPDNVVYIQAPRVTIQCTPSGEGLRTASLQINSNDGTHNYYLQCTGNAGGCPTSQPTNCPELDKLSPPDEDLIPWLGAGVDSDRNWLKQEKCLAGDITSLGNSGTELSAKLISSFKDVLVIKKASAGGKFSIKFFKAHADAKYTSVFKQTSYTQSYVLNYNVDLGSERISNISISERGNIAAQNACDFRRYCGDKYVSEITKGGKVYIEMNFKFKTTQQTKEFSAGGGVGFAGKFSVDLEASVSGLSKTTKKQSSLQVVAHQEGGDVTRLIDIFGSNGNSTSCSLDDLELCKKAIDDIIAYMQDGFAKTLRDYPSVLKYKYSGFDFVMGAPDLVSDVTPEIEQAREDLAAEYEKRLADSDKVRYLLQYSLPYERKQKMTTLLAALENDVESLSEAGVVCFSDLGNCLAKECEAKKGLANYDPNELIAGFHPDDGLAAYYPLDGNANDESGHERHGTIHKTVTPVADRFGNENGAYKFDGYIQVSDMRSFQFKNQSVTFSAWVIPSSSSVYRAIVSMGSSSEWISLRRHRSGFDGGRMSMSVYGSPYKYARSIESGNALIDNGWLHVVGIADYEEREIRLYINNVLQKITKGLGDVDVSNGQFRIGYNNYSNKTGYWKGLIDDVRIYERAISDSEIKALYSDR